MSNKLNVLGIIFLLNVIQISILKSQDYFSCGYDHNQELYLDLSKHELKKYQNFQHKFLKDFGKKSNVIDTIFVKHQIVRLNGDSIPITLEGIDIGMAYVNERLVNSNIYLEACDITYIDENDLFEFESGVSDLSDYRNKGFVDIFYVSKLKSGDRYVGGIGGGKRVVTTSTSGSLLAHELGHAFGLPHTHGKYNFEPTEYPSDSTIQGFPATVYNQGAVRYFEEKHDDNDNGISDCFETGDNICDTPAEYVLSGLVECRESGLIYNGNERDFFGDLYIPELGNEMSYGCKGHFTPGQYARMRFVIESFYVDLLCKSCRLKNDDLIVNKEDNIGIGSLAWAMACADLINDDEEKMIILDIPKNKIEVINSFPLISSNNTTLTTNEGRVLIDASKSESNYIGGLVTQANNIKIENLILKGFDRALNVLKGSEDIEIKNVEFVDNVVAINIDSSNNISLINSSIKNSSSRAIQLIDISNFHMENCQVSENFGFGLNGSRLDNPNIIESSFLNNEGPGISIRDVVGLTCERNEIKGNGRTGLWIGESENTYLKDNEVLNSKDYGIVLGGEYHNNAVVLNNKISENEGGGIAGFEIDMLGFENNTVKNNLGTAIWINRSNGIEVSNNVIENSGGGIQFFDTDDIDLGNNLVSYSDFNGITISESTDISLLNIKSINNTGSGIVINNVSGISIESTGEFESNFSNNELDGISISNSQNIRIESANIEMNNRGVYFRTAQNLELVRNIINENNTTGLVIAGLDNDEININNCSILKNLHSGLQVYNSKNTSIKQNLIKENGSNQEGVFIPGGVFLNTLSKCILEENNIEGNIGIAGVNIQSSNEVELYKNDINENYQSGIRLSNNSNIIIGGNDEFTNTITKNNTNGIDIFSSENVLVKNNSIYCNLNSDIWNPSNQNSLVQPVVLTANTSQIEGTGEPNSQIDIYRNTDLCENCQLEELIISTQVNSNGDWQVVLEEIDFNFGETVKAISHSDNQSSNPSPCVIVEVPAGCFSEDFDFPAQIVMEDNGLAEYRKIGESLNIIELNECNMHDLVLKFDAKNLGSENNIIFTNTFNLVYSDSASFNFDIAHKGSYSNRETYLDILISTDCGAQFDTLFSKGTYSGLLTVSANSEFDIDYSPISCDEWENVSIDLIEYVGQKVMFKIEGRIEEFWGQNLYLDNLELLTIQSELCATLPFINDLPDEISACENDIIELKTGNETDIHKWYYEGDLIDNSNSILTVNNSGAYKVEIIDGNGCLVDKSINVKFDPTPDIILTIVEDFCEGDTTSIVADSNGEIVAWYFNGESIGLGSMQEIEITESGEYSVEIKNEFECIAFEKVNALAMNCTTPTNDINSEQKIVIYPNPVSNSLFISITSSSFKPTRIKVFDMNGIKRFSSPYLNGQEILDVNFLSSGIYMIIIENDEEIQTARFVKH